MNEVQFQDLLDYIDARIREHAVKATPMAYTGYEREAAEAAAALTRSALYSSLVSNSTQD